LKSFQILDLAFRHGFGSIRWLLRQCAPCASTIWKMDMN
jgi:hypothetical protein